MRTKVRGWWVMLGLLKKQFSSGRQFVDEDSTKENHENSYENGYENIKSKIVALCEEKSISNESYKRVIVEIDKRIKNKDYKYKLDLTNCNLTDDLFEIVISVLSVEPYLLLKLNINNNKLLTNASLSKLLTLIKNQVKNYNSKKISDQLNCHYLVDVTLPPGSATNTHKEIHFNLPILEHANYSIKLFKLMSSIMKKRNLNGFLDEDTISAVWVDQFGSNAWTRYPVSIAKSNHITFAAVKNAIVDEMVRLGKLPCLNVDQMRVISQVDIVNNQTVYNSNDTTNTIDTDDKNVTKNISRSSSPKKGTPRAASPKKYNASNPEIDNIINEIIFVDNNNLKSRSRATSPVVANDSARSKRDVTPVVTSTSPNSTRDVTPVVTSTSPNSTRDATPVVTSTSPKSTRNATPVVTSTSPSSTRNATPVVTSASPSSTRKATPNVTSNTARSTRNSSRNSSPTIKNTVSPANTSPVDMKSYILNNFSKASVIDDAAANDDVDKVISEVNTSQTDPKVENTVPAKDEVSDISAKNSDHVVDNSSPSKNAFAANDADIPSAIQSIDVSPISKSNVTFSSDVTSSPEVTVGSKYMPLSPYTATPQSLANSLMNIEHDIFTHLKQEHMKALFGSDSPEKTEPSIDFNSNTFQFVGKSLIASHLDLSGNNLESFNATTFPFSQSSLSQILVLDLSHNSLNSCLKIDFCVLSCLIDLNLKSNMLTGTMYCDRIFPASLKRLDVSHNQISGIDGLGSIDLISLNASYNRLSAISLLPSTLKQLYLQKNNIDDPFTFHMFGMCPKLTDIGLEDNPLVSKYSDWRIRLISFLPHIIKIDGEVRNLSLLKMKSASVSSQNYNNISTISTKSSQKSPQKSPYKSPKRVTKSQQLESDEKRRRHSEYQSIMLEQKKKELENYYDQRLKSTLYDKCTSLRGGKPLSPTKLIQLLSRLENASIRRSVVIDLSPNKNKSVIGNSGAKKSPKKK